MPNETIRTVLKLLDGAACLRCAWNNDHNDTACSIAEGRCSHCENATADQYDAYPLATFDCSGFKSTELEIRRLEKQVRELWHLLNASHSKQTLRWFAAEPGIYSESQREFTAKVLAALESEPA